MKPVLGEVRMHNGINESILTQWVEYYLSKGK